MSRTIKAIERHMIPQSKVPPVRLGLQSRAAKLVLGVLGVFILER